MVKDNNLSTPAYLSFTTFTSFVKRLNDTAIPPVIDSSVLAFTSGATASQIKTALRFLGLTDDQGHVTKQLRDMVTAQGTDHWAEEWQQVTADAYNEITKDLDLDNATHQQLRDAFRRAGASGSVLDKAVRFYIATLDAAKLTYSPHFRARGAAAAARGHKNADSGSRPKKKGRPKGRETPATLPQPQLPEDWKAFPVLIPDHERPINLELPVGLTQDGWAIVRNYVESYFKKLWEEDQ